MEETSEGAFATAGTILVSPADSETPVRSLRSTQNALCEVSFSEWSNIRVVALCVTGTKLLQVIHADARRAKAGSRLRSVAQLRWCSALGACPL